MLYFSNFIQYILFPYDAACKCQGKDISVGLSKYSSSMKGSVLVHWVPGAGASTKIKYKIIEKVNKI